jgi:hypothetical protein
MNQTQFVFFSKITAFSEQPTDQGILPEDRIYPGQIRPDLQIQEILSIEIANPGPQISRTLSPFPVKAPESGVGFDHGVITAVEETGENLLLFGGSQIFGRPFGEKQMLVVGLVISIILNLFDQRGN